MVGVSEITLTPQRFKRRFEITLELVSVFLAVTLALALNQWNQDRIAKNSANEIFQKLSIELAHNQEKLAHSINSFESTIIILEQY